MKLNHAQSHLVTNRHQRVCVVGTGTRFLSRISYYTYRLADALSHPYQVSAILMCQLIPSRFYPGNEHVGAQLTRLQYGPAMRADDGANWFWLPSMVRALAFLVRERPEVVLIQWSIGRVFPTYLLRALVTRLLGAWIVIEFRKALDTGEANLRLARAYVGLIALFATLASDRGKATQAGAERQDSEPVLLLEVELSEPLPAVSARDASSDQRYVQALALVRLHTQPIGLVELELDEHGLSAEGYSEQVWRSLRLQIIEHLRQDGLPEVTELDAMGLPSTSMPTCLQARERLLAHAPFVSIVVATHDRPESVLATLRSLLGLNYPHYEIIVIDNAPSTNATADLIQQLFSDEPRVRYVREDWPGLASAHNRGLVETQADIVAFTDDDVLVDQYWLAEIVKAFRADDQIACVTGMILPREIETKAQRLIEQFGGFNKGFKRRLFNMAEHRVQSPLYPYTAGTFGSGANMAFRTAILRKLGGFDPALGAGSPALSGDDLEAFFEIINHGYTLVYEPAAFVYHAHREDYPGLKKQVYGYGVGLTAYLTKVVLDHPRLLLDMVTRIPYGLFYALRSRSPKNIKKGVDYPAELTRIERKGMLYGPFAYLRSRRQAKKLQRQLGSPATRGNGSTKSYAG